MGLPSAPLPHYAVTNPPQLHHTDTVMPPPPPPPSPHVRFYSLGVAASVGPWSLFLAIAPSLPVSLCPIPHNEYPSSSFPFWETPLSLPTSLLRLRKKIGQAGLDVVCVGTFVTC